MHAVVDEPRVALVFILARPKDFQQRSQADLAVGVLFAVGQGREHGADRFHFLRQDLRGQLGLFQGDPRHVIMFRRVIRNFPHARFDDPGDHAAAGTAAFARLCFSADRGNTLAVIVYDDIDDLFFAYTVTIADLRVVGQVRGV